MVLPAELQAVKNRIVPLLNDLYTGIINLSRIPTKWEDRDENKRRPAHKFVVISSSSFWETDRQLCSSDHRRKSIVLLVDIPATLESTNLNTSGRSYKVNFLEHRRVQDTPLSGGWGSEGNTDDFTARWTRTSGLAVDLFGKKPKGPERKKKLLNNNML